ncbi:site-specific integrase [Rhizosphaericola mali]|uniref:Site-specific integrase n=1 Tax=Rhizosphaericola mali TaxID=2545455 RepID=A0A5P2FYK2_9BACT|nr:site-specific integrase [Rhizosphaericola mali]QES88265.1 site-specific integrase [Rhizosphaericola mali]
MAAQKQTIGIFFFPRKNRTKNGKWPLYIRITVDGERQEFSLKEWILPTSWDETRGAAKGNKPESKEMNTYLEQVRAKVMNAYRELNVENKLITAELLRRKFLGLDETTGTLLELIDYHNENMQNVLTQGTLKNYYSTKRYVLKFLKMKKKRNDLYLSELNYQFLLEFEQFVKQVPLKDFDPCHNNGLMKHIERLKKMVGLAIKLGWLSKDPFVNYKLKFQKFDRPYLNELELKNIELVNINLPLLNIVRDLFVFSCYTGLAPIDLGKLSLDNLVIGVDGGEWIHTERQKTKTIVNVPLLPKAKAIVDKYRDHVVSVRNNRLFPMPTNQEINRELKILAELCNIKKYLTFYMARHTFATTVTLNNGVPLETVSKMMGHTKLSTTQVYARLLNKKIGEDMALLSNKLSQTK